ncbi:alpha/beta hydrolase [Pseudarthrobacter sp. R1]|uniref:alpha/beta fold hydrolase n=1 Tax=Pseudarthrobacter sp. R1 TaxID=2944934 RepID=UPI00210E02CB|nr:alpha/beta hydrolase [Pseudarthrobacter sp. R1]MCQ6272402.1 alpha/beta hydrolase [Pseudarthrobacter sp. R1]
MPWLDVLGNDIHYTDSGAGRPVVLLHGHASAAACWEPIIAELEQDFRVLAYDTYDHGWSSNSPRQGPLVDRVAELEHFISSLGLENPLIVGQSMGGMTALRWAIRNPAGAGALVVCGMGWPLVVPPPGQPGQPEKFEVFSSLDADEGIWLGVGASFTEQWIAENPRDYARYIRVRSTATAIEAARHPRSLEQSQGEFLSADPSDVDWFQQGLESISCPLVVMIGDEERPRIRRGAEHVAATVPGARLLVVEEAGHNAYFQRQDILVETIRNAAATA